MKRCTILVGRAFTVLVALGVANGAMGQERESLLCSYYPATFDEIEFPREVFAFSGAGDAEEAVDSIVEAVIRHKSHFEIREAPAVGRNAAAAVCGGARYVFYGPEFFSSLPYWWAVSILAHEVGHHFHGHTLDGQGSRPEFELAADHFSGLALQKMGASLADALAAMESLAKVSGSSTHPPRAQRLAKIHEGWMESCQEDPNCNHTKKENASGRNSGTSSAGTIDVLVSNQSCLDIDYKVFHRTREETIASSRLRAYGGSRTFSLAPGVYRVRECVVSTNRCDGDKLQNWSSDAKIYLLRQSDCR